MWSCNSTIIYTPHTPKRSECKLPYPKTSRFFYSPEPFSTSPGLTKHLNCLLHQTTVSSDHNKTFHLYQHLVKLSCCILYVAHVNSLFCAKLLNSFWWRWYLIVDFEKQPQESTFLCVCARKSLGSTSFYSLTITLAVHEGSMVMRPLSSNVWDFQTFIMALIVLNV